MKGKRVFITGGAGFIANRLIQGLVTENHVTVYDNFKRDSLTGSQVASSANLKVVRGDVLDFEQLITAMNGSDVVIHAAAIAGIDSVVRNPVATMRVNMIGTANALEAARITKVGDRFIDFSTSEVFGSMAYKVNESSETVSGSAGEARWTYAVSKLAGEHLAQAYFAQYGLPVVTVRPFNVYGPGQTGESAMLTFIKLAAKGQTISIDGDGSQIRAWCFIDDFVSALMRCLTEPQAVGQSINIGNPRAVMTILGLAQTICRVMNSVSNIVHREALSADIAIRIPDVSKAMEILGFRAKVDLEEGIRLTADWLLR
jgi:UDP-glucose 4-epimerase